MNKKTTFHDSATMILAKQVNGLILPDDFSAQYEMTDILYRLRDGFKDSGVRKDVLITPDGRPWSRASEFAERGVYSAGFCGVSSYIWNHLFRHADGREIFRIKQYINLRINKVLPQHSWNENTLNLSELDLTFDQSVDETGTFIEIPYFWGQYISSDYESKRALKMAEHLDIDLGKIVLSNTFKTMRL